MIANQRLVFIISMMMLGFTAFAQQPLKVIDSLKKVSRKARREELVDTYNQIAWNYRNIHADSTFNYAFKASDLANQIQYKRGSSIAYNFMGIAMRNKSIYSEAMSLFFRALKSSEKNEDLEQISYSLINIGNIYLYQSNYDGALQYFDRALNNAEKLKNDRLKSYAFINKGRAYMGLNDIQLAKTNFYKSIEIRENLNDLEGITIANTELLEVYIAENQLDSAEQVFKENIQNILILGHQNTLAYSYISMAKVHLKKKQYELALDCLQKCFDIAGIEHIKNAEILALQVQSQIFEECKKPSKALKSYKRYMYEKDSLFSEQSTRKIEALFAAYANEKSELEKHSLMEQMEFDEMIIHRQRIIIFLSIISAILFLIVAVVAYRSSMERKKLNDQIQKQKEDAFKHNNDLIDINNEKNNLIRILSHDLRAPINNIKGLAQLYQTEQHDISKEGQELLDMVKSESDRLLSMIKKILNVEALEDEKKPIRYEAVDLCKVALEVVQSFQNAAVSKDITLVKDIPEGTLMVKGDEIHLYQVLENLTSNALKFSEKNKEIHIKIAQENGTVRASIKDEGPGLTAEDESKLFKKFQTLSAKPTGDEESTGLGLSIVKKYVSEMEGSIWHESKLGEGTTFYVEFEEVN